jgi:hypothetical protein
MKAGRVLNDRRSNVRIRMARIRRDLGTAGKLACLALEIF